MATIFTKIIEGEIPSHKVAESEKFYAFLDIRPLTKGHTLVVPKKEVDYFFDLEHDLLSEIMVFARGVAKALEKTVSCERVGITVAGLEVPHAHVHLIPMNRIADLSFEHDPLEMDQEELAALAEKIRSNYQP
jgi:histidine triad (HIT) family protein